MMTRRYLGMTWRQYDKAASAYHEGGHATVAVLIDKPFKTVSIIFRKGTKGAMDYDSEFWEEGRFLKPEVSLLTAFAGARAQRRFAPNSKWRSSGITDVNNAAAWLEKRHGIKGEELHALMTRVDARTCELVEKHWDDICRVAAALLAHGTMTENEVRRVLGKPPRVDLDALWRNYSWPELPDEDWAAALGAEWDD
jgi:ATP-dependent Zn protease